MQASSWIARTATRTGLSRTGPTLSSHLRLVQTSAARLVQYAETAPQSEELDPALQQLLLDADLALSKSRRRKRSPSSSAAGIDFAATSEPSHDPFEPLDAEERTIEDDIEAWHNRSEKASPEASFGSKYIGISSIPPELERAIDAMINDADKHQLRSDAKRLFLTPTPSNSSSSSVFPNSWTTELPDKFKENRKRKSARLTPREALVYSVIAIPGQYAAIQNVLRETRKRLGDGWANGVKGVVDFGSATGVGMWATLGEFKPLEIDSNDSTQTSSVPESTGFGLPALTEDADASLEASHALSKSTIEHYLLLENRRALLSVSKKLTTGVDLGSTHVHQEDFWGEKGKDLHVSPDNALAIMAFTLSELPNDLARRQMLREMWNTGADTMVIIDHASESGFAHVTEAREYLLKKGRYTPASTSSSPVSDSTTSITDEALISSPPTGPVVGSHVVTPCPHDGVCPLTLFSKHPTTCSFTQRLERPSHLRKTKHASRAHEFMDYSYVVIRRGERPAPPKDSALWDPPVLSKWKEARLKKRAILAEAEAAAVTAEGVSSSASSSTTGQEEASGPEEITLELKEQEETTADIRRRARHWISDAPPREMEDIRSESYYWPRLLKAPLKRGGHVVMETCTKEGNIARHTIPKSQGKQHYYDARKAHWGDAFPWESKNGPDVRTRGKPIVTSTPKTSSGGRRQRQAEDGVEPSDDTALDDMEGEWEVSFGKNGEPRMVRSG